MALSWPDDVKTSLMGFGELVEGAGSANYTPSDTRWVEVQGCLGGRQGAKGYGYDINMCVCGGGGGYV